MSTIIIDGRKLNVDPTVSELGTYQKHGLKSTDRKPTDYLAMVAKTFSSFRSTPTNQSVVSYISGLTITLNEAIITETIDWLDEESIYNIFKISLGACIIDNQLIDIYEDTVYTFKNTEFIANTKYGIIIEYDFTSSLNNVAKIKFIDYESLNFPRLDDLNVVSIEYTDSSLDSNYSTVEFSGKPGLLIGTFATNSSLEIIQSSPVIAGTEVHGIDPQYLSKLYIKNYKLLFEYFGNQARPVFSSMGLTNANFISIPYSSLDITGNTETDIRSGDMCYLNPETKLYSRSIASNQRQSKVIGLYLNEINEGNHLIYLDGIISVNKDKHNLSADHQLLNLIPGFRYYLEDSTSLFDMNNSIRTINNYVLANTSGRISSNKYSSAVGIGHATASNQIILNIDNSNATTDSALIEVIGKFDEYKSEFDANSTLIDSEEIIVSNTEVIASQNDLITSNNVKLGSNDYLDISNFAASYASEAFTLFLAKVLPRYFINGSSIDSISSIVLDVSGDISSFSAGDGAILISKISLYSNIKNIKNLLNESSADLESLILSKISSQSTWLSNYTVSGSANQLDMLNIELKISRFELGDNYNITDKFEDPLILANTLSDYTSEIASLESSLISYNEDETTNSDTYANDISEISDLIGLKSEIDAYIVSINSTINEVDSDSLIVASEITALQSEITSATLIRDNIAGKILDSDSVKLDIFLMDEYQRTMFNYTYITDRLQKRLILVDVLADDLVSARTKYTIIMNNSLSTVVEKVEVIEIIKKLELSIESNNNLIENYTLEYNKIRVDTLALSPITKFASFDDGGYANQEISNYRYGCDNFETTYDGLATNLISVPCGPYTNKSSLIIEKNAGMRISNVISNDGHSDNLAIEVNYIDASEHGTSILSHAVIYENIGGNFTNYVITKPDGTEIQSTKIITNNSITFVIDDSINRNTLITGILVKTSVGGTIISNVTILHNIIGYTPNINYAGSDIIGYRIIDSTGVTSIGSLLIEVTGPYITPDIVSIVINTSTLLNVLSNDGHSGTENIALNSVTQPLYGTVTYVLGNASTNTLGSLTYIPSSNFKGSDSFEYSIIDESGTIVSGITRLDVR